MDAQLLTITEDEFYEKYRPIDNHLDKSAGWGGKLYETFGEERDFCFQLAQKENCVWTVIECDDTEMDDDAVELDIELDDENSNPSCLYIISGFHIINRIGFMITEEPYEVDTEVKLEF